MNTPSLPSTAVLRSPVAHRTAFPEQDRRRHRILVVDDDPTTRALHCLRLAREGFEADPAADGEEAWTALRSASYDLVLTDEQMPNLTGLGLVGRMRAAGMNLPVIVNSGSLELGGEADYPQLRLAAVLRKPLSFGVLLEAVRRHASQALVLAAPFPTPGTASLAAPGA